MRCDGKGVLAFWNDTEPTLDQEYNEWHAGEHVPERLTVPGMLNAYRYKNAENTLYPYFTLYEMRDLSTLETPEYKRLLSHPTPWSQKMRQHFKHIRRVVCHGIESSPNLGEPAQALLVVTVAAAQLSPNVFMDKCLAHFAEQVKSWRFAMEDTTVAALPWASHKEVKDVQKMLVLVEVDDAEPLCKQLSDLFINLEINQFTLERYDFLNQFKTKKIIE